ncbi:zf-C2HC5-domain-containing protein [Rhizodiscina lignyota]|uniref:Zf-C2HC5-domain-containing protein n=1 Tax=Rhizodiscina lignyota TaxID=1504668 RepID=A0A9P4IEX1_9PEZI|nr:zf-C2HC5-domain-containing protein [Rhizodiscina lignyota]
MALASWAVPQLSKILPLDDESLREIVTYADSLPKEAAAEHLKNLLGDSPQAFEFISNFNSRRQAPQAASSPSSRPGSGTVTPREDLSEVPKAKLHRKKPSKFNQLPTPRRPDNYGDTSGGYVKRGEEDYMAGRARAHKEAQLANTLALQEKPDALQVPLPVSGPSTGPSSRTSTPKPPPSAAGPLISDIKSKSRSGSPAPSSKTKAKVNISGGTNMHGQSSTINDLDSAIRTLEVQTNPSLTLSAAENAKRRCNCMATRHSLLEAAPNCLNCGKIICVKQGLGPCTFCESPLLSSSEIQAMVRILRDERGKEKMEANNAGHKRAEVSRAPRPFANLAKPGLSDSTPASSAPSSDSESEKLAKAKEHRDRLLAFQAQNARRTRVHDEAADFETPTAGQSMWASPQERALQLKRQQKVLREQEWNARPEWEKRKVVASIDLSGKKLVKKMEKMERPATPESEDEVLEPEEDNTDHMGGQEKGGAFSKNPLLGTLIKPVARVDEKGKGAEGRRAKKSTWRRVQDDGSDNEQWILDGGTFGGRAEDRVFEAEHSEEPA